MAILAAYASAISTKDSNENLTSGVAEAEIQAAVDAIAADVDASNQETIAAAVEAGNDEHNQAIADSIDDTLGKIDTLGAP